MIVPRAWRRSPGRESAAVMVWAPGRRHELAQSHAVAVGGHQPDKGGAGNEGEPAFPARQSSRSDSGMTARRGPRAGVNRYASWTTSLWISVHRPEAADALVRPLARREYPIWAIRGCLGYVSHGVPIRPFVTPSRWYKGPARPTSVRVRRWQIPLAGGLGAGLARAHVGAGCPGRAGRLERRCDDR